MCLFSVFKILNIKIFFYICIVKYKRTFSMKRIRLSIIILSVSGILFSQNKSDSLVLFSGLKYTSDFEKKALTGFVENKKDTFNLMLAIDDKMTPAEASQFEKSYLKVFDELTRKKIDSKNANKKVPAVYSTVHNMFLKKYQDNVFFPDIFRTGTYNCVTATILYSMVFDRLKIPYKVMASKNHAYVVANPGPRSIVIETTNPSFEKSIFTGEFKQQYVDNLRNSKQINEQEYKNRSMEEIFEAKFNQVDEVTFTNLPGFQYYNLALTKGQNNEFEAASSLSQKAYFFYSDPQVKSLLQTTLLMQIQKCNFDKVSDIDYLGQLSRLDLDENLVSSIFNNIINDKQKYTDKQKYCDSIYSRLVHQISNKSILNEIIFGYNMQLAYQNLENPKAASYAAKALNAKPNHKDAINIFKACLLENLEKSENNMEFLDTLKQMEKEYTNEQIKPIIKQYEYMVYLNMAKDAFNKDKPVAGEKHITLFETSCTPPVDDIILRQYIERAYYSYSSYYYRKKNKTMSQTVVNRGLKYVPKSSLIKSTVIY